MNIEKMAEFLRSLREDKGLTQDQLGDMLNVSRSLVSKWEHASKIPAVDCLMSLSKIYDITIDEIIYGERKNTKNAKDIESLSATIMNESKKKIDLAHKSIIIVTLVLSFLLLGSYFIFNYNSIKVYSVGARNDKYDIKNTLMIISKNKSYIKFGDIVSSNEHGDKEYDGYEFYAKDDDNRIVLSSREDGEIVRNLDDSDNFLNFTNLEKFIDDLYVDVYYNDEVETIKLIADLEMANNKIFNINKDDGSNIKKENMKKIDNDIPKIVSEKFSYDSDNNCYKYNTNMNNIDTYFQYDYDIAQMLINVDNIQYLYDYNSGFLNILKTKNGNYERLATYDIKNDVCVMLNCDSSNELISKFKENYYELIKK